MRTDIAFPFRFDRRGRTACASYDDHVRDLIEQVLFTNRGERVMRPDFGCGLLDLVFAPHSPELLAALELSVHASVEHWLGDLIEVESLDLDLDGDGATIRVVLRYTVRRTGNRREELFEGSGPA
jgi:uncharacterized protein